MKPVFIILHKKHRKYSSVRSPFLSGWRKTGHVQMIYKHGSPKGVTKVNRWSTPTQYTIPKREKYIKPPKKNRYTRPKETPTRKKVECMRTMWIKMACQSVNKSAAKTPRHIFKPPQKLQTWLRRQDLMAW